LLRKLAFENIVLIICLWHPKLPGCLGPSVYRHIIDEAKELLKTWFQKELKEEEEKTLLKTVQDKKRLKTANFDGSIMENSIGISIPIQPSEGVFSTQQARKERLDFRPNMFRPMKNGISTNRSMLSAIPHTILNGIFLARFYAYRF